MWELILISCIGDCIGVSDQWFTDLETCQAVGSIYEDGLIYCADESFPRLTYQYIDGVWVVISGVGI